MAQPCLRARRQGDPHAGLRLPTLGSEEKTLAHRVPFGTNQKVTITVSSGTVWWGDRAGVSEPFNLSGQHSRGDPVMRGQGRQF